MLQFKIIYITEMANLKSIFPLLFFEHGYLTWCKTYRYQIFNMDRKHSDLGKGVFILEKKTGNFCDFFVYI